MGQPGFRVMIGMLGGNKETVETVRAALGKKIASIRLNEEADRAEILLADGSGLVLRDDGQSCCERRFMVCDDDLSALAGSTLTNVEIADAPNVPDEWGEHEVQFLRVITDKGVAVFSNHNEHNGYYGGFWIVAEPFAREAASDEAIRKASG